ncbi:carbohydrate esterase family 5 protein [Mycena belliarum]|uniref:cutinase n=1 Tax=Mycena belliarum TaxID=1033014 RepID=A0AAD6TU82_9AGAR|nr:carbohydrate esterase family 5 protein [Mycena belliae]
MKYSISATLLTFAASALLSSALPVQEKRLFGSDTADGMSDVLLGDENCKDMAVIFARGTFDSGNIGVWVGPQFKAALESRIPSLAFQGVEAADYPATLGTYLGEDGGSDTGAASLAAMVADYVNFCPKSTVVVSGWSQGARVAHKALALMTPKVRAKVAGLAVFGDPHALFSSDPVPKGIAFHSECFTGSLLDPLCSKLPGDFKFPTSIADITGPFSALPGLVSGAEEAKAAASLVLRFPGQLLSARKAFTDALTDTSKMQRLLLSPQHFMYGNKGLTGKAADFVAGLKK